MSNNFYLHISNRTENLLNQLAEIIELGGREDIFTKELFLIQSQGMERIISQSLAKRFKTWCNFKYLLPLGFIKEISSSLTLDCESDFYDRKNILWQLEALLRNCDDKLISSYVSGNLADLKRFQLAKKLANIFDQYQLMRPEMLAAWEQGETVTDNTSELWQMSLWQQLSSMTEEPHRGDYFTTIIKALDSGLKIENLPKRISVFGLHIMPPMFLDFLSSLSKHCDVHLYVLSPCQEYWGDVLTEKALVHRLLKHKQDNGDLALYEEEEPQQLLASLGRQGRDFQRMLVENVEFRMEFANYSDPTENVTSNKLLHVLQSDLLNRNITIGNVVPDESLQIVSCHSRFRELGVLKDYLLKRLYEDEDLKLRDIVVMAPDIQEYAPLIPAVFSDIYHSIADRALRRRNSVMGGFISYLQLFSGRFGWSEVLDLLRLEEVYPQFDLGADDFDFLQKWIIESGVRWGIDATNREDLGLPSFDLNTWHSGLQRLLLGLTMSEGREFADILAYDDIEGGAGRILGGLCEFISFLKDSREQYKREHSLDDWAAILLDAAEKLFGDSEETLELKTVLADLIGVQESSDLTHSFKVVTAWLEQAASESRSSTGFMRGQLTFCSMLPMRSIPFKVVCLLGLQEGEFPKQDRQSTFDLMASNPRLGDRSPRVDDRYQFLEAIISARDFLYLSYVGRSIKNNEEIPPSVVVSELCDVLRDSYNSEENGNCFDNIIRQHPLYPFSKQYFQPDSGLDSYNKSNLEISKVIADPSKRSDSVWWQGRIELDDSTITMPNLLSFYKNPQEYFVRKILELRIGHIEDKPEDSELFTSGGLDRYLLQEQMLHDVLAGKDISTGFAKYSLAGRWPLAGPGELEYEKISNDIVNFTKIIKELDLGESRTIAVDKKIGDSRLIGELRCFGDADQLFYRFAKRKGKDLINAWLNHLIGAEICGFNGSTYLLCQDGLTVFNSIEKPLLQPYLQLYLSHFKSGCENLSALHIESACSFVQQEQKSRATKSPLQAAKETLVRILENSYELGTALAIGGRENDFLDDDFVRLTSELMAPIWEHITSE